MLALGRELAARGHEVTLQTWAKWEDEVRDGRMAFAAAPEYHVFPTRERPMKPYAAVVRAAREMAPLVQEVRPQAVVADILTLAPALAGEVAGVPVATVVPHVYPPAEPSFPPYALGARLPRTALGRAGWQAVARVTAAGLGQGRDELNETRRRLGLPAQSRFHGGISADLCLVGTFPQLEYPRRWPPGVHVVGPLLWEPPSESVELPPGDDPLVLVAPSTSQDPGQRLLRATLAGLADEPVRVIATFNRRPPPEPVEVPPNARLVDWLSYERTMPRCDVVVLHAGHGTLARALACGCSVVACPAGGDMAENAARADWAGVGVRLPSRLVSAATVRLAVRRALAEPKIRQRAAELAAWARRHDGARAGADLVERFARSD